MFGKISSQWLVNIQIRKEKQDEALKRTGAERLSLSLMILIALLPKPKPHLPNLQELHHLHKQLVGKDMWAGMAACQSIWSRLVQLRIFAH